MAAAPHRALRVNVLFDGKSAENIADHLREAGLQVEQEFDLLAVITGRIDAELLEKLQEVEGVLAVEEDREVEAFTGTDADDAANERDLA